MNKIELKAEDFPVKEVSVYKDRAQIKRTLQAKLEPGTNTVHLSGISDTLLPDSIRVEGTGNATITEVSHRNEYVQKTVYPTQNENEVKQKIDDLRKNKEKQLRKQLRHLQNQKSAIQKTLEYLEKFSTNLTTSKIKEETGNQITNEMIDGFGKFLGFYEGEKNKNEAKMVELDIEIEQVTQEIHQLMVQIQNLEKSLTPLYQNQAIREILITLETSDSVEVSLTVIYLVTGATWEPVYDVRVLSNEEKLSLVYKAHITQSTGENWNQVKLSLSTATPATGGEAPEFEETWQLTLKPKFIPKQPSFNKMSMKSVEPMALFSMPAAAPAVRAMAAPAPAFDIQEERLEAAAPPPMRMAEATVQQGLNAQNFEIPNLATIPSDNMPHTVTVQVLEFKPTFKYQSCPKLSDHCFLKINAKNTSAFGLMPGEVSVYLDHHFITKSSLKHVSPEEEFEFSLGLDDQVKVKYTLLEHKKETSGLLTKQNQIKHSQRIEIHNTKQTSIELKLMDQLPKSSDEKIKVSIIEPAQYVTSEEEKKGEYCYLGEKQVMEWLLKLKAQEKRKLDIKYVVSYPTDETIEGI